MTAMADSPTRPPLIGICGRVLSFSDEGRRDAFSSSQPYSRAVAKAGGLPMLLPPLPTAPKMVDAYLDRLGGLLLPGGGDVEPSRYGQEALTDALYGMVGLHDEFDLALTHAAIERDLPVLAICRGMQILNVAQGGSLVQDLDGGGHWMSTRSTSCRDRGWPRPPKPARCTTATRCITRGSISWAVGWYRWRTTRTA
jgi:putative glutamine amidotransferase